MGETPKHIFEDLRPEEEEEKSLLRGSSLHISKEAILRRMILEILPHLGPWAQANLGDDPQALRVLQSVKSEKALYEEASTKAWNALLERIIGMRPEIHLWSKPPEGILWMANAKKHPFLQRGAELLEDGEEALLMGWNQYCGPIACEILEPDEKPLEKKIRHFPSVKSVLITRIQEPKPMILRTWAWDKRNFQPT
jgi:hypothetical protein